jgi:hypothetical protein
LPQETSPNAMFDSKSSYQIVSRQSGDRNS